VAVAHRNAAFNVEDDSRFAAGSIVKDDELGSSTERLIAVWMRTDRRKRIELAGEVARDVLAYHAAGFGDGVESVPVFTFGNAGTFVFGFRYATRPAPVAADKGARGVSRYEHVGCGPAEEEWACPRVARWT
jgi:hypothetical protein